MNNNNIKKTIALLNGANISNKMVKNSERCRIKLESAIANEMTDAYNLSLETMFPTTESDMLIKLREEHLNALKYAMYYGDWDYR